MNCVKFSGLLCSQMDVFHGLNLKSCRKNVVNNFSCVSVAHCIGLNHGKGDVSCHFVPVVKTAAKIGLSPHFLRLLHKFRMDYTSLRPLFNDLTGSRSLNIVITTHHKPDGDAMGSSLGLYHVLKKLGHQVQVITPTDYASFLHWLPGHSEVVVFEDFPETARQFTEEADLIFCLDFNDLSRINEMGDLVSRSKGLKCLIDHHRNPSGFQDFTFWTIETSSTCELIYDFIHAMERDDLIDKAVASCLYTGIMTDTGSFRFNSTSAHTHLKVARLIEKGADSADIHQKVFDHFTLDRSRMMGYVLYEKLQVFEEYQTALVTLNKDELARFNVQTGDTEGFVNFGLGIEGVRFSVLIIDRSKLVKLSFRSKGSFACNDFAATHFNGGGHLNAAGGSSEDTLEQTTQRFLQLLPKYKELLLTP